MAYVDRRRRCYNPGSGRGVELQVRNWCFYPLDSLILIMFQEHKTCLCTAFISTPLKDLLGSFGALSFSLLTFVWLCLTFDFPPQDPCHIRDNRSPYPRYRIGAQRRWLRRRARLRLVLVSLLHTHRYVFLIHTQSSWKVTHRIGFPKVTPFFKDRLPSAHTRPHTCCLCYV